MDESNDSPGGAATNDDPLTSTLQNLLLTCRTHLARRLPSPRPFGGLGCSRSRSSRSRRCPSPSASPTTRPPSRARSIFRPPRRPRRKLQAGRQRRLLVARAAGEEGRRRGPRVARGTSCSRRTTLPTPRTRTGTTPATITASRRSRLSRDPAHQASITPTYTTLSTSRARSPLGRASWTLLIARAQAEGNLTSSRFSAKASLSPSTAVPGGV